MAPGMISRAARGWAGPGVGSALALLALVGCKSENKITPADNDGDGFVAGVDCDDGDPDVHPEADEVCDERDNDCDGLFDDEDPSLELETADDFFVDSDDDGYGFGEARLACAPPAGYVANGDDCDDDNPAANPAEDEVCDLIDNDCDELVDDEDDSLVDELSEWRPDADGDGAGDEEATAEAACFPPMAGYVANGDDCDDEDETTYLGAPEICDGIDNDCDEVIDDGLVQLAWYADTDEDGFGDAGTLIEDCVQPSGHVADATDCNDEDPDINPAATEIVADGVDSDCDDDELCFVDADEDGFRVTDSVISDDWECDGPGEATADQGFDCDDTNAAVYPGAEDICDKLDNDCDTLIDEDAPFGYFDVDQDGFGAGTGVQVCELSKIVDNNDDCDDIKPSVNPLAVEICDGIDNDCDDGVDEPDAWWNTTFPYRATFTLDHSNHNVAQPPVMLNVDAAAWLIELGEAPPIDIESFRVVVQGCDNMVEVPSQFHDGFYGVFEKAAPRDDFDNGRGILGFLYDEDGDLTTKEVLSSSENVEMAVYFGILGSGVDWPGGDYSSDQEELDNRVLANSTAELTLDISGVIESYNLAGEDSVVSQVDAPAGNGVYFDSWDDDPQDEVLGVLIDQGSGPIFSIASGRSSRGNDSGTYEYRNHWFMFAYHPEVYMTTEQTFTEESTLSHPDDAMFGLRPWASVHDNLVDPVYTYGGGVADVSDGVNGFTFAWMDNLAPDYNISLIAEDNSIVATGNDYEPIGAGTPQVVDADEDFQLGSWAVLLPHTGWYDSESLQGKRHPVTAVFDSPEAVR